MAFLGVIWTGLPMILFPVAQQWIDSSVAGMLNGAVPWPAPPGRWCCCAARSPASTRSAC